MHLEHVACRISDWRPTAGQHDGQTEKRELRSRKVLCLSATPSGLVKLESVLYLRLACQLSHSTALASSGGVLAVWHMERGPAGELAYVRTRECCASIWRVGETWEYAPPRSAAVANSNHVCSPP